MTQGQVFTIFRNKTTFNARDNSGFNSGRNSLFSGVASSSRNLLPTDIHDNVLWIDASDKSTIFDGSGNDANNVSFSGFLAEARDKSGLDNHVAQSVASRQGSYNATGLDGYPCLDFDGLDKWLWLADGNKTLRNTDLTSESDDAFTIFAVGQGGPNSKYQNNGGRTAVMIGKAGGNGAGGTYILGLATANGVNTTVTPPEWVVQQKGWSGSSTTGTFNSRVRATGALNTTEIITHRWNGTANTARLSGENFDLQVGAPYTSPNQNASLLIGGTAPDGSAFSAGTMGDSLIGQIIVYDRALTDTEIEQVEGFLHHKYGKQYITDVNHPYYNSPPTIEINRTLLPTDISGNNLWLDFSDKSTIFDGSGNDANSASFSGAVAEVRDKSGLGLNNHVYSSVASQQPTSNTLTQNGLNVLDWGSAINQKQLSFDSGANVDNWQDMYVVFKAETATAAYKGLITGMNGTAGGIAILTRNSIIFPTNWFDNLFLNTTAIAESANIHPTVSDDYALMSFSADSPIIINGIVIGMDRGLDIDRGWQGQIAEVVSFNRKLSDYERQQVEGILLHKWGRDAVLASDHPFKVTAPTFPVPPLPFDPVAELSNIDYFDTRSLSVGAFTTMTNLNSSGGSVSVPTVETNNNPQVIANGIGANNAIQFDGDNDLAQISFSAFNANILNSSNGYNASVAFLVKFNSLTSTSQNLMFFSGFGLYFTMSNTKVSMVIASTNALASVNFSAASGNEYLVVVYRDGDNHYLRVNGTAIGSTSTGVSFNPSSDTSYTLGTRIGSGLDGDYNLGAFTIFSEHDINNIEKVEGKIMHDFGLTSLLPSGHTYKTSAP